MLVYNSRHCFQIVLFNLANWELILIDFTKKTKLTLSTIWYKFILFRGLRCMLRAEHFWATGYKGYKLSMYAEGGTLLYEQLGLN
jgi:hypothetical protein